MADAAERAGIQVLWDLCHYGWPDDLDLFSPRFIERFARYAGATASFLATHTSGPRLYAPFNEISFMAYAIGEQGEMFPYALGRGAEVKRQLVLATLAAIDAIRAVDPEARILHIDPLFHAVPPLGRPDLAPLARANIEYQFETADMLRGRLCTELGGAERYLDIVGVNYYFGNQWEFPGFQRLRWEDDPRDERWLPLRHLLARAAERYERPLFIAETSHFGAGRCAWLREISEELAAAISGGVPLAGVCLYPILDRPDCDDPAHWHNSGLFDRDSSSHARYQWKLNEAYAAELYSSQRRITSVGAGTTVATGSPEPRWRRDGSDESGS
jgi:beta-glucosidase/6-phospho-beta-glucosidase/beta-galactosidase